MNIWEHLICGYLGNELKRIHHRGSVPVMLNFGSHICEGDRVSVPSRGRAAGRPYGTVKRRKLYWL